MLIGLPSSIHAGQACTAFFALFTQHHSAENFLQEHLLLLYDNGHDMLRPFYCGSAQCLTYADRQSSNLVMVQLGL